jgi:hypothetical protein
MNLGKYRIFASASPEMSGKFRGVAHVAWDEADRIVDQVWQFDELHETAQAAARDAYAKICQLYLDGGVAQQEPADDIRHWQRGVDPNVAVVSSEPVPAIVDRAIELQHLEQVDRRIAIGVKRIETLERCIADGRAKGLDVSAGEEALLSSQEALALFQEHRAVISSRLKA